MNDMLDTTESRDEAFVKLQREREFYRKLLDLADVDKLEPFLAETLALMIDVVGADRGYIELNQEQSGSEAISWFDARGCSEEEVQSIRAALSTGIMAEARATGKTIVTASATRDPRFKDRKSVRAHGIEAVLCAPIGKHSPIGVLYLQGRANTRPFSQEDRQAAETFARHIAPLAERLILRQRAQVQADPTLPYRAKMRLNGVIGHSQALARLFHQLVPVAALDVSVLLTGPSGTGKTQFARILHDNSPRVNEPFVELNCATLTENLLESELFGAMPGAHSAAMKRVRGKLDAAQGGTLFLDEIAELKPSVQAKLLQFLQSRQYYPLGSTEPSIADVRLIAATNVDLAQLVAEQGFRADLYYRLTILTARVPSLAERMEDVPLLAEHFMNRACDAHKLPCMRFSPGALRALATAEWPGNIRQLSNAVEAGTIRAAADGALIIDHSHIFPDSGPSNPETESMTFHAATQRFQRQFMQKVLDEMNWNISEVARRLDLTRSHVYNLIRAFALKRAR